MSTAAPPPALVALLEAEPTPQRAFAWNQDSWRATMHDLPDVLDILSRLPGSVDRHSTRVAVLAEYEAKRVLAAFVAAMIWGHGTVGYGPIRVRWVLTGKRGSGALDASVLPAVSANLSAAARKARERPSTF